jgi:hypothetical protein
MRRREFLIGATTVALAELSAFPAALAAGDHVASAIDQIDKAIPYGERPHQSSSFVQHLDNAIDHAVMAQKAHRDAHVRRAIAYLRRARRTAYGTHLLSYSRRAAALAKKALSQLQAVKQ